MAITGFTAVPSRLASRQELVETTNTFFSEVPQFVTEANELQADVNAKQGSAAASAVLAGEQAVLAGENGAAQVALAAEQVGLAAGQVALAEGQVVLARLEADRAEDAALIATGAANYQGDYDELTTYQIGESVSEGAAFYVAKTINLGVAPVDGANWGLLSTTSSYQEYTESGTYTVPPGATSIFVYAVGAGASGIRLVNGPGGVPGEGIGKSFRAEDLPATVAITIGAGGEWVAGSPEASVEGGDTTFGSYLTAFGGRGRAVSASDLMHFGKRTALASSNINSGSFRDLAQAVGLNINQGVAIGSFKAPACIYGGGVGGAARPSPDNTGGDSVWAGAGGDGSGTADVAGGNGNFPGGGGGSTTTGTGIPGNGADGVIRIWAS